MHRAIALLPVLFLAGCASPSPQSIAFAGSRVDHGIASHYGEPQGLACSRGRFDPRAMTAAHKTLPCGTRVRVVSRSTGAHVDVTINDRGPYVRGRVIDLSTAAAGRLGMLGRGLDHVDVFELPPS